MSGPQISALSAAPQTITQLSRLLVDVVAAGGSVGFMHPLPLAQAQAFWSAALLGVGRGERVVLGAYQGPQVVATVTLLLHSPPNQPHRAEITKMMTHPSQRGRGLALALLMKAEAVARQHQRTLLVLDTAEDEGAAGLYEKAAYIRAGRIPDYAFKPRGGLSATLLYYKALAAPA